MLVDSFQRADRPDYEGLLELFPRNYHEPYYLFVEPQPPSRLLPFGYFKPLTAPDPLDAITANLPAGFGKKRPDPSIAIASIMRSQRDNRSRQRIFIRPDDGGVSLRPAWLADDPTGMTFRETVLLPNVLDCLAAPLGT